MASQQVLFAETIVAMKKAVKRKAYESESDSEIEHHDNRGHKLKKRARFVHEGQLAPPSGPEVYRETVNHGGFQRTIISRNPVLVDDEGYELDSDDDEEHIQDVADAAAEFDPYTSVRLENILAPLTTITDLPTHPTLSRPYTSKTLTELTKQGCDIMHKENAALWKVKHLQTKLVGDQIWVPCEVMLGPNDIELYRDDYMERLNQAKGSTKSDAGLPLLESAQTEGTVDRQASTNGEGAQTRREQPAVGEESVDNADTSMADAEPLDDADTHTAESSRHGGEAPVESSKTSTDNNNQQGSPDAHETLDTKTGQTRNTARSENGEGGIPDADAAGRPETNGLIAPGRLEEANDNGAPQRHQAKGETEPGGSGAMSVISDSTDDLSIHPFFLPPRSALPDRDLGIPEAEAEDIRRLLQLYVQKQEEVCRGSKRLYEGLLRANRMRKTVLQWSKHEAHVGPNRDMSDGEDWYDKEEWGLEEDLKKGQDEEEEDTTQTTKKTRTRR